MEKDNLKEKTLSGLIWQFAQKFLNQGLSFFVTVILAHLLLPSDYGVVALASMFNILIGVILDNGLNSALIQKKKVDDLDYNTVFFINFFMSFIIYAVIFLVSPYIAKLYDSDLLCPIMRTLSLSVPLGSLTAIQSAIITKRLQFRYFFYISVIGSFLSAIVGILMAYRGYGPWALVGQNLTGGVTSGIIMFLLIRWIPKFQFSKERFYSLFSYAWKKQVAGIIGTICDQLKGYLIGFRYSTADLAYFNRGEGLPEMFRNNIAGTIEGVLFPALTKVQDNPNEVKKGLRRSMMTSSYILTPLFWGLAAISSQIVPLLYGPNWTEAIPFMQVACLTSPILVLNKANLMSIFAIGKSGEVLKLELYKKPAMISILFIAVFISPLAISIGMSVYAVYVLYMNTRLNAKYLDYSLLEQINDVKTAFLIGSMMAVIVYVIGIFISNSILALCIQIPIGALLYITISHLLRLEAYIYIKDTISNIYHTNIHRK